MSTSRHYSAFLLRLWQEQNTIDGPWRISLHDVHSGEQYGFRTPDELCAYLRYRLVGSASEGQSTESKIK